MDSKSGCRPGRQEEKKPRKGKGRGRGRADKAPADLDTISKILSADSDFVLMEVSVWLPESVWNRNRGFLQFFRQCFSSRLGFHIIFFSQLFHSQENGQPNAAKNEAVAEKPVAEKPKGRKRRVSWFVWVRVDG